METQPLAFEQVNLAAYNPRVELKPGDPEWKDIEASLEEFGQVLSLVWNKRTGNLVAGHQRIRIMKHRGETGAVFTVVDLELAAEKRLNLILNKVSGRWAPTKLNELLADLREAKLDVDRLGFTPLELHRLLGARQRQLRRDPNSAPGLPVLATTRPGDLLELSTPQTQGPHRLLCGDARDPQAMARLCAGWWPRLVFTDPPYNVQYDNSTRGDGRRPLGLVQNDAMTPDGFLELLTLAFANAHTHTMDEAPLYTFLASATHVPFAAALGMAKWQVKQQLIWAKHFALSRADYHYAHEPMMYASKAGQRPCWFGPRSETTLWNTAPDDLRKLTKEKALELLLEIRDTASIWHEARLAGNEYVHPTQKPIGLCKRALVNSSLQGEAVLDMFAGSGSTLVAAETLDRVALCMELEPLHCDVIVTRFLETFEGATATRNGEAL